MVNPFVTSIFWWNMLERETNRCTSPSSGPLGSCRCYECKIAIHRRSCPWPYCGGFDA